MRALALLSTILLFCAESFGIQPLGDSLEVSGSLFKPVASADTGEPQGYQNVISLYIENDIYFSDRYYTNGLRLSYTGAGDDFYTSKLQFAALRLFDMDDRQAYQTVSLGQMMYVNSNIENPNPPLGDRPYAGWLYMGFGAHLASQNRLDSFTVNLGVVGPISLAEDAQKFWHSIMDAHWPMGWQTQIKNEPGIILSYNHSERFVRVQPTENFSADVIGSLGGDLGNVMTQATARTFVRWGFNMPYSFEPNRIDYASGNDVVWRASSKPADWHCFMFAGGAARFVGYDITLNGNTFADSRSVVPKWLVGEAMVGISSRYKNVQADLNWTLRTADFNHQEYPVHMFWSLAIKVFY